MQKFTSSTIWCLALLTAIFLSFTPKIFGYASNAPNEIIRAGDAKAEMPMMVVCNVSVSTTNGAITISGMTGSENTKVFTSDHSVVWACNTWSSSACTSEETITGLDEGATYFVSVVSDECQEWIRVVVEGDTCPDGDCLELNCVEDIVATANPGDSNIVLFRPSYYEVSTDCSTGDVTITSSHDLDPGADLFPIGVTEVTVTATDDCGNTATCSFTVTVNAIGPCHFDQVVPAGTTCDDGDDNTENDVILADGCTCEGTPVSVGCNVSVTTANGAITISGMTGNENTKVFTSDNSVVWACNPWSGSACTSEETITGLNVGATYFVSVVSEECQEYIPVVIEAGISTCPNGDCLNLDCVNDIVTIASPGATSRTLFIFSYYNISTDCSEGAVTITSSRNLDAGSDIFPVGVTEVTVTATDECGNVATCSFTVTVIAFGACHFGGVVSPGTTCNDGDDDTENDVILADGCTCRGEETEVLNCSTTLDNTTFMGTFGESNYFLSDNKDTWQGGQQFAANNGGYLASIGDALENEFIRAFIDETKDIAFIGYQDTDQDGEYEWDSGEAVDYTNVPMGTSAKAFTNINFWNGEWKFDGTTTKRKFIIEVPCDGNIASVASRDMVSLEAESSEQKTARTIAIEKLFPNPTSEDVFVKLESTMEQDVQFTVLDSFGKVLEKQTHTLEEGTKVIPVLTSDLPGGMYLLMIKSDQGSRPVTKRFFKVGM